MDIGDGGEPEQVRGRRITLAAGAIGSPAILLRSGIGPKAALASLGIEPVADLPGVGAGLTDHPVTRLLLVPKPGSCDPDTPLAQVVLRYTAPGSGEFNDMQQVMFSHVDVAGIGGAAGGRDGGHAARDRAARRARTPADTRPAAACEHAIRASSR